MQLSASRKDGQELNLEVLFQFQAEGEKKKLQDFISFKMSVLLWLNRHYGNVYVVCTKRQG